MGRLFSFFGICAVFVAMYVWPMIRPAPVLDLAALPAAPTARDCAQIRNLVVQERARIGSAAYEVKRAEKEAGPAARFVSVEGQQPKTFTTPSLADGVADPDRNLRNMRGTNSLTGRLRQVDRYLQTKCGGGPPEF